MTNNDVFKQILHLTGLGRNKALLIEIFALGGITATDSKIKGWRTDLSNPRSSRMTDHILNSFFNGLFEYRDQQIKKGVNVFNFQ